jgi:hypothetical protein
MVRRWERRRTIKIKTPSGEVVKLSPAAALTIRELKTIVWDWEGVPPERQRLRSGGGDGRELQDSEPTLDVLELAKECSLDLEYTGELLDTVRYELPEGVDPRRVWALTALEKELDLVENQFSSKPQLLHEPPPIARNSMVLSVLLPENGLRCTEPGCTRIVQRREQLKLVYKPLFSCMFLTVTPLVLTCVIITALKNAHTALEASALSPISIGISMMYIARLIHTTVRYPAAGARKLAMEALLRERIT